jgi:hypothetical protein
MADQLLKQGMSNFEFDEETWDGTYDQAVRAVINHAVVGEFVCAGEQRR